MRAALLLLLAAFSPIADAPIVVWHLVPVEWKEMNLCVQPCMYKWGYVTEYEWRAE